MSEVSLALGSRSVITVRLEANSLHGRDMAGQPALCLPLQLQLLPSGEQRNIQYTLVRLAGRLQSQPLGEFAGFELGPLAEIPNPNPFFRQQEALVVLDRRQIKRLEDARAEKDARLGIMVSCLVWHPTQPGFEVIRSAGYLEIIVPRSHWVDRVLSAWNLSNVKVLEIEFPSNTAGGDFRASYAKIESAEKLFANGQWKQTLGELYAAFETLAKARSFAKPDQQFFTDLFSGQHPAKREKLKRSLDAFCDLLHLGRHEPNETAQDFAVSPQDARFALIMAHAVFEYITPGP